MGADVLVELVLQHDLEVVTAEIAIVAELGGGQLCESGFLRGANNALYMALKVVSLMGVKFQLAPTRPRLFIWPILPLVSLA